MTAASDIRIIIQCRTTSSRLPAKAFLDVYGLPAVVLCAKRLQNQGAAVTVATSDDPSDDALEALLHRHSIAVHRGALDDVLGRFISATADLPENSIIVRMTADNLFPDGAFISACIRQFRAANASYATTTQTGADTLPYGMSAEVFTLAALKEAAAHATTAFDREHVTPYIRRHHPVTTLQFAGAYGGLRCTMDTPQDYQRLLKAFADTDVLSVPWQTLCDHVQQQEKTAQTMPAVMLQGHRIPAMSLGTVQLGLPYGITNTTGQPDPQAAMHILAAAYDHGIRLFDTAAAYGEAEQLVGRYYEQNRPAELTLATKLPPQAGITDTTPSAEAVATAVEAAVLRSCRKLGRKSLDYYLLHRWEDYHRFDGAIWRKLLALRDAGIITRLGTSLYSPEEALAALEDDDIAFIQLPFNLLDHRWRDAGVDSKILALKKQHPDRIIVQARSVFLQGLLVNKTDTPPRIAGFDHAALLAQLDGFVQIFNRLDRQDLCLAYVRAQPWIDTIVCGVDTAEQLRNNAAAFTRPPLSHAQAQQISDCFNSISDKLLNPSTWQNAS